jgi:hypothetical protein
MALADSVTVSWPHLVPVRIAFIDKVSENNDAKQTGS